MQIRFFNTVEPVSPLYRDLLPELGNRGVEVEVVLSRGDYRPVRKPLEEVLTHPRIRIKRVGIACSEKRGKGSRLLGMLSYAVGAILLSLKGHRADLNVFLTQPPLFSIWGYALRLLRKEPYLCVMMDVYPDVAIRVGILAEKSWLAKLLKTISIAVLRNSSAVVVIGRCMHENLVAKGVPAEKIHFIPNWVNERDIYPIPHEKNRLRKELNLGNALVVLYSGNLGISHHFESLLEIIRRMRDVPGLRFIIVGGGAQWKKIENVKREERLENLLLLPFQPMDLLAESLSMGDVHLASLRDGFEGLEVPSKAYGALAVGRPLIYLGNPSGEIARMVEEAEIGFVVPDSDVSRLEAVILRYLADRTLVAQQGERALCLGRSIYSSSNGVQRYISLLMGYSNGQKTQEMGEVNP